MVGFASIMPRCLVAVGSNLGDRASWITRAVEMLCDRIAAEQVRVSPLHETAPIGVDGQTAYLNAAMAFDTGLEAGRLHEAMRTVEEALGRQRTTRWAARTIDLDLLLYGNEVIHRADLVVPHPRMAFRRFVLAPAAEVAPAMLHPTIGWSVSRLLEHLDTAKPYVAIAGLRGCGKTALAGRLSTALDGRLLAGPRIDERRLSVPQGASRAYAREIELLARRAVLLDRESWPEGDVLAISDFYLDQCLAYAELALGRRERDAFGRAFRDALAQVVLPKLLVVLDTPRSVEGPAEDLPHTVTPEQLRAKLVDLTMRRDLGPVLRLDTSDSDAQFTEVAAAIEAMR